MNMYRELANRALLNVGMKPLTDADREGKTEAWETAKTYYLQSMLEALSRHEWTGAKRRRELAPMLMPCKGNRDFRHAYRMPIDCAKPIELDGQVPFEVEGPLLFTDAAPARLLYVSNGRYWCDQEVISGGDRGRNPDPIAEYLSGGDANRHRRMELGDNVVSGGGAGRPVFAWQEWEDEAGRHRGSHRPEVLNEDFPEYRVLELEPGFYLYWECLLSAKLALRVTDKPGLADSWLAKAMVIGKEAATASIAASSGRVKPAPTWQEELGLGSGCSGTWQEQLGYR